MSINIIPIYDLSLSLDQNLPLDRSFNRGVKRSFDIIGSIFLLILFLPWLILTIFLIHRLKSPGPLFYIQTRGGLGNKTFEIIKFRTMHVDSSSIFSMGRFLRKTGIDEIPQLINVLKGDMSLIGPRPHLVKHDAEFRQCHPEYDLRMRVLPGITGFAQVRGFRGKILSSRDVVNRVNSDIYYVENWTILLDIIILIRTIGVVLCPPTCSG
jgi:putative colanic acid biosynthesis UDP-glucose lipid carrier transferase